MMKKLLLLLALAVVACKGNSPAPNKPEPPKEEPKKEEPVAEGATCDKEIKLECPEGQVDGCTKTPVEGTVHACVPQ
jgi:hypothetical protein